MGLALAVAVGLVAYNTVTNLWLDPAWYLGRNLVASVALVAVAQVAGVGWGTLGLAPADLGSGLRWGRGAVLATVLVAAVVGALAGSVDTLGRLLADRRADLPPGDLAFHALLRIPIGTALFEELAFRGVLLALFWRVTSLPVAVVASSVAFGLWHVSPTIEALRVNDLSAAVLPVSGMVVVTALAGIALSWLRLASGSLLAPILAHWAVNASFLLVAALFHRTGT